MAAYSLSERFPRPPDCHKVGNLDPGAYNILPYVRKPEENKAPFLSRVPRNIKMGTTIYTHEIYNAEKPQHIQGVTAFRDTTPRFVFENTPLELEEEEEYVCDCELKKCTCPVPEEEPQVNCQAKVRRKIYKGKVPLGAVYVNEEIKPAAQKGPVFYDTRVKESTAMYHGCKWSQRTTRRGDNPRTAPTPGPADYQVPREPTAQELCLEEFRFHRRHNTRQLRFIEMVQLRNILQNAPGPADYDPKWPSCRMVRNTGSRAARFPDPDASGEVRPGPADYDVDGPGPDFTAKTNARTFHRAPLGGGAERFRQKPDDRPGPGQYSPGVRKARRSLHCPPPPFFSSAPRFKSEPHSDCEEDEEEPVFCCECPAKPCVVPTAVFKSRTKRFKPLVKRLDYPSPADFMPEYTARARPRDLRRQRLAPFRSSEGRFQPWHDWLAVHAAETTPGPGALDLTSEPHCVGRRGGWSLATAARFPRACRDGPPPNAYVVKNGVETVWHTFNERLRENLGKRDKFRWSPPFMEPRSMRSREACLLAKSIHDLDVNVDTTKFPYVPPQRKRPKADKPSRPRAPGEQLLLRYFLYDHQFVQC